MNYKFVVIRRVHLSCPYVLIQNVGVWGLGTTVNLCSLLPGFFSTTNESYEGKLKIQEVRTTNGKDYYIFQVLSVHKSCLNKSRFSFKMTPEECFFGSNSPDFQSPKPPLL